MSPKKRTYETPKVEVYGSLREVTNTVGNTTMVADAVMGMNKTA